ncbi:MAG: M14-type cytosolic carboxypeptidase [Pirellulaceae bacterium]
MNTARQDDESPGAATQRRVAGQGFSIVRAATIVCLAGLLIVGPLQAGTLTIHTDFAGGSGRVVEIDQVARRIRIEPSAHPGLGWECWWYFRLTGAVPGETLVVEVGKPPWATPTQAAFSTDDQEWQLTEPGQREAAGIRYHLQVPAETIWLAWGPPYTLRHAAAAVRVAADRQDGFESRELCRTADGRPVPALQWNCPSPDRFHVWIQARQHAWEAGSSWVCQGFLDWLSSDDEGAVRLRERAQVTVVPIMDVDNVERGAGGKNQLPHDHNRDWSEQPHFAAVAAAQRAIQESDERGLFDVFIDLHNPDAGSTHPFFFVTPRRLLSPRASRNLDHFLAAAQLEMVGPLAFTGQTRESGESYDAKWRAISKNWVSLHTRDHVVSVTLETAWNTPHSSIDGYRTVGRQLGMAVERYLRANPRE